MLELDFDESCCRGRKGRMAVQGHSLSSAQFHFNLVMPPSSLQALYNTVLHMKSDRTISVKAMLRYL